MFSQHHSKIDKLETILSQEVLAVVDYTEIKVTLISNGNVRLTSLVSSARELRPRHQSSMRLQAMKGKTKSSMAIQNMPQQLKEAEEIS
jgi:hypothetical protein